LSRVRRGKFAKRQEISGPEGGPLEITLTPVRAIPDDADER
jgi:hypothetical protein